MDILGKAFYHWEQGWRSGENARLPPMCPGFNPGNRRHLCIELRWLLVLYSVCSERFSSGYSGFLLSSKPNISKFQFDPGMHGHFGTSSCELLGAPWVNKVFITYLHTFYICLVPRGLSLRVWEPIPKGKTLWERGRPCNRLHN